MGVPARPRFSMHNLQAVPANGKHTPAPHIKPSPLAVFFQLETPASVPVPLFEAVPLLARDAESSAANTAALIAAVLALSSLVSLGGDPSKRSKYPVSILPEMNSSSTIICRNRSILVLIPPTKHSCRARNSREIACGRSFPAPISLARSRAESIGTVQPSYTSPADR